MLKPSGSCGFRHSQVSELLRSSKSTPTYLGNDIVSTEESLNLHSENDTSVEADARPDRTVGCTNAVEQVNEAKASPRSRKESILFARHQEMSVSRGLSD